MQLTHRRGLNNPLFRGISALPVYPPAAKPFSSGSSNNCLARNLSYNLSLYRWAFNIALPACALVSPSDDAPSDDAALVSPSDDGNKLKEVKSNTVP